MIKLQVDKNIEVQAAQAGYIFHDAILKTAEYSSIIENIVKDFRIASL